MLASILEYIPVCSMSVYINLIRGKDARLQEKISIFITQDSHWREIPR